MKIIKKYWWLILFSICVLILNHILILRARELNENPELHNTGSIDIIELFKGGE